MLFWKEVIDLYINAVIVGVVGTLLAETALLVIYAAYISFRR